MSNIIDYEQLSILGDKVKAGTASKTEKDQFMLMLYSNGNITKQQYEEYLQTKNSKNSNEVLNAALAIGAVTIIGYLLSQLFEEKK